MNVLMLAGSLRSGSWTQQALQTVRDLLPADVEAQVYAGLADLPHYDQDLDTDTPPSAVVALREAVAAADALVLATPEYNGSVPGVLKNAIDWASRPRGEAAIAGKPAAVVSVSPSPRGAQWAREDLVKILGVAGAEVLDSVVQVASVHDVLVEGRVEHEGVCTDLHHLVDQLTAVRAAA